MQVWGRVSIWWMQIIVGTKYEVRGLENIPSGGCLLIGKHQSFWETFAIMALVDDPAIGAWMIGWAMPSRVVNLSSGHMARFSAKTQGEAFRS